MVATAFGHKKISPQKLKDRSCRDMSNFTYFTSQTNIIVIKTLHFSAPQAPI